MTAAVEKAMQYYRERRYERAYAELVQAALVYQSTPDIVIGLALTLEKLGRFAECVRQWQYLKTHIPKLYTDTHKLHHASALIEAGNYDAAEKLLKEVDATHQDNGRKWRLIERLLEKSGRGASIDERISVAERFSNGMLRREAVAGVIVSENEALIEEYEQLIRNTPDPLTALAYQSIILVTYGRTGSTLLQGLLNTINGVVMFGENENAFYHLFEYARAIEPLSRRQSTVLPSSPFFGAGMVSMSGAMDKMRETIQAYFAPVADDPAVTCVGFKEIRFKDHPDTLADYLLFLEDVFPKPAFLFLWRDHDAVLKSGWWKNEDKLQASALLEQIEGIAQDFALTRDNCFEMNHRDLTGNSQRLREMFNFLGAEFDAERIARVKEIPHSYDPESPDVQALFSNAQSRS